MLGNTKKSQMQQIEEMVICPYISNHRIKHKFFLKHLNTCRRKLSKKYLQKFETCRYNILHIFPTHDIKSHERVCPNREFMKKIQFDLIDEKVLIEEISKVSEQSTIIGQENIDQACKTIQYLPLNIQFDANIERLDESDLKDFNRFCPLPGSLFLDSKQMVPKLYLRYVFPQKQIREENTNGKILMAINQGSNQEQETGEQQSNLVETEDKQSWGEPVLLRDPNIQNERQVFLEQCQYCCSILKHPETKLWRNKKLNKYLKMYEKLNEEAKRQYKGIQRASNPSLSKVQDESIHQEYQPFLFVKKIVPRICFDEEQVLLEQNIVGQRLEIIRRSWEKEGNQNKDCFTMPGICQKNSL